ncbi:carbohydrate ABC transporter permease [Cohnella phaseoli]|uniref:Putative aldouronate transport system permease protein n=1 Tax=Cohnella phaseoli TaxID=456490 RepID=A0A3D9I2A8_9BACL|nr:carbohydrate ABC transporter permease [Cohnella phaseoli]RED55893.1 putative aldouronate transport system permease protein [Cohnella phaseoli]
MIYKNAFGRRAFDWANYVFLGGAALLCLLPLIHVLAVSFSASSAATAGFVKLWPVDFTLASYKYALNKPQFIDSFLVSLERVALGALINMTLTVLIAYPLSKERRQFRWRSVYAWFFVVTILFSGGLIPVFMVVKQLGLLDSIWALVLPGAVPVFNVILLLNFMRSQPKELYEAAFVDGAGHWSVLWRIAVPLAKPALATLLLFICVGHWNSWFDGLIYMNKPEHFPLQTYLQSVVINRDPSLMTTTEELKTLSQISDQTTKAAQIFLAALPILLLYPFLQKHFIQGITLGSVKE